MNQTKTLTALARSLADGSSTSVALTTRMLERARDPDGEGSRVFLHLDDEAALAQARAFDLMRTAGVDLGPLMGVPISVKDLFDIKGQITRAGSVVLQHQAPASEDAVVVKRLRRAGAVIIGRTNMVEFAYSGIGLNPHYGTPKNPWDRATGRVPGGSSSGAPVSVLDGMAAAAIGTDTGGSVRIPAALCGLTGFKPTARRVPTTGAVPLSTTLDSIGPLAPSVACCRLLDAIMADVPVAMPAAADLSRMRFLVASNRLLEGLDVPVASAFGASLAALSAAGAAIVERHLDPVEDLYANINVFGSFSPPEAFAWHRKLLARAADQYDPRVASRIAKGAALSAADYIELGQRRLRFIDQLRATLEGFDALLMPTVTVVAPAIAPLIESDALYWSTNSLLLRNTSLVNFLDGCAVSLPIHGEGMAPVGLALVQCAGCDAALLALAERVEQQLQPLRG